MRGLFKPHSIPVSTPHINWGVVGACLLLAVIGIAFWNTTIGKVMMCVGAGFAIAYVVLH